jgi:hypothetical protein
VTCAHTPIGSRLIIDVWSFMYSPADRPSSIRAAPAKNRSWSTDGGSSSDSVRPTGLPVFLDSTRVISSARCSTASAKRSIARLRSAGVASRQVSNAVAATCSASSTSAALDTGACAYASPVLGSTTSLYAPSRGSVYLPFTKFRSGACAIPASCECLPRDELRRDSWPKQVNQWLL